MVSIGVTQLTVERVPPNFNIRFTGDPVLIQSSQGNQGNFELLVPLAHDGLAHYWRDNDATGFPWHGSVIFGQGRRYDAVSMIQSNYGNPKHLEVIARSDDRLFYAFRDDGLNWNGPFPLTVNNVQIQGLSGNPVLIQSSFGDQGNFELLVPLTTTQDLGAYSRENDRTGTPWTGPIEVEVPLLHHFVGLRYDAIEVEVPRHHLVGLRYDAITMIQSNMGLSVDPDRGNTLSNLEVVARHDDKLFSLWRDMYDWNGPFPLTVNNAQVKGVSGNPVLIQSSQGNQGNFELLVPLAHDGLAHYWRDNDATGFPWHGSVIFGQGRRYDAVSMIQSNYGNPKHLEVIARSDDRLFYAFRDDGLNWNGPFAL